MALAGGPRSLVLLTFLVAAVKRRGIYLVPEYAVEPLDVAVLASVLQLSCLSEAKLRVLAEADGSADEVARRLGLDSSTVYRHFEDLVERGLAEAEGSRRRRYRGKEVVRALSRIFLQAYKRS